MADRVRVDGHTTARIGTLVIANSYARPASKEAGAAIFLEIENQSIETDRLVQVQTPSAERSALRNASEPGDVDPIEHASIGFAIPGHAKLIMHPGHGPYIELVGPDAGVVAGSWIEADLSFDRAGTIEISIPVRPIADEHPS